MSKVKSHLAQETLKASKSKVPARGGSAYGGKIDIEYVAKLANLPLSSKERKTFEKQLPEILKYVSKLNKVNTDEVESISHITGLVNVTRSDEPTPSLTQQEALANAPKTHNGFFEVEAIFEEQ